jgi:hypothetical protein
LSNCCDKEKNKNKQKNTTTRQNGEWAKISTRQNEIELAMFGE